MPGLVPFSKHIAQFLERKHFLCPQDGFRRSLFTTSQVVETVRGFRLYMLSFFSSDFPKACVNVPHNKLIFKVRYLSENTISDWLASYTCMIEISLFWLITLILLLAVFCGVFRKPRLLCGCFAYYLGMTSPMKYKVSPLVCATWR